MRLLLLLIMVFACRLDAAPLATVPEASQSPASDETISLVFGHEDQQFAALIESVASTLNISLQLRIYDSARLKVELLQRAARQRFPDAVIVPADFLGLKTLAFSDVPSEWVSPDVDARYLPLVKLADGIKGIPLFGGNHLLLYYNKSQVSEPISDWSQALVKSPTAAPNENLFAWNFNVMYWFMPFVGAFDGLPIQGDTVNLDTPAMQNALRFYWSLADAGLVAVDCHYQCAMDKFTGQQVPYLISGIWAYGQLTSQMGEKLGVALLPKVQGKPMVPYYSAHVLAFPGNSLSGQKKQTMQRLSQAMQSVTFQKALWEKLKALPVHRAVTAALESSDNVQVQVILAQLNAAAPMPSDQRMAVVWEAMSQGFNRYGSQIYSAGQATRYMQHMTESTLQSMRQGWIEP